MKNQRNVPSTIVCPSGCGRVLHLELYFPDPFFEGRESKCPACGKSFDLWDYAVSLLRKKAQLFRNKGAAFIGGREVSFTFQLAPNQTVEIDLSQHGVPKDSRLLYMVYTPTAGAGWPIEMHGNQPLQHRTTHRIFFYGKPSVEDKSHEDDRHDVDMFVTYIPRTPNQIPFENIANAYEHFLADNYEQMILPSAVALEYAIERTIVEVFQDLRLPDNLNPSKRISLEVIIPLVCRLHGIRLLDGKIVEHVLKLWNFRNQLAHEGSLRSPLNLSNASQLLAAAMFCLNYIVFFKNTINKKMKNE